LRKLAIDYGKKRIGLAIGDFVTRVAVPLDTMYSHGIRNDVDCIASIVQSREIDTLVIGMPLNMDGSQGRRAKDTLFFGNVLQRVLNIEVVYIDERLSSIEASSRLSDANINVRDQRRMIDQVSAQIILQEYIDKYHAG
jgi:putative Holliday junction resolvase